MTQGLMLRPTSHAIRATSGINTPPRANSNPFLKRRDGVQALLAMQFPYNPGSCVKLIIRNVVVWEGLPPVIFCDRKPPIAADKLCRAVWVTS